MTEIVHLSPTDAPRMAAAHEMAFGRHEAWSAAAFAELLSLSTTRALGAHKDGALLGLIVLQAAGPEVEILTIAVIPAAQRGGLARRLFERADRIANAGCGHRQFLDVAADNQAALTLYERLGFREDGQRRNYYRRGDDKGVDAILMSRSIAGQLPPERA